MPRSSWTSRPHQCNANGDPLRRDRECELCGRDRCREAIYHPPRRGRRDRDLRTKVNTNLPTTFHTALSYDGNNAYLNLILNFAVPSGKKLIESRSGTRVNFLHRHITNFGDTPGTQLFLCCRCKMGDRNPLGSPTNAAGRYSHPRSPNAERSTPGGAYHPPVR
jgi:hypothetical protein